MPVLSRPDRLRGARAFQRTYAEGATIVERFVALHLLGPTGAPGRKIGFAVSKKVGNAVLRNRVRRRLQAIVRPLVGALPEGFCLVLAARTGAGRATFPELAESTHQALARAGLLPLAPSAPEARDDL